MRKIHFILILGIALAATACKDKNKESFAYGNFEATEVIVSAQASGQLMQFTPEEGQTLKQGQVVGYVDTLPLQLKKQQLLANRKSIASRNSNVLAQVSVLRTQLATLTKEQKRFEKLVSEQAATQKQLDDITAQINSTEAQIRSVETQSAPILNDINGVAVQIQQIEDQVNKSIIRNPVNGTVLVKYAEPNEVVSFGKPLYSIANLDTITLRVYVSGNQLSQVRLGQNMKVLVDNGAGGMDTTTGTISWIASQAEFTPKTVQTRDERVNLVYAVKLQVKNDGRLKIGMPAEVQLMENNK